MRRLWSTLFVLFAGLWFAQVQVSSLFLLQAYYTASFQAYLLLVTAWIAGALLGVWITARVGGWLWIQSALWSFALVRIWSEQMAFPIELTWALLVLTALPAGQLFQEQADGWPNVGQLFFVEALGFILGLVLGTGLLMQFGLGFCQVVPVQALVLAAAAFAIPRKRGTKNES